MSIKIETVKTESFEMEYFKFGRGKEPLVILPGLSVQSVMPAADIVAEAYDVLADDFTVYLFDRRKDLPSSYSVADIARDTFEALSALGLAKVCLFGVSQGGMAAQLIAAEHPELVKKLAVGSSPAYETRELRALLKSLIEIAKAGDAEKLYLSFGEAIYPGETFENAREMLIDAAKSVTEAELCRFVILAEGIENFDAREKLKNIACPTLAIFSFDDNVIGAGASADFEICFAGRSDFETCFYDGYGHAAYDLAPDYKERLKRFFTDGGLS